MLPDVRPDEQQQYRAGGNAMGNGQSAMCVCGTRNEISRE